MTGFYKTFSVAIGLAGVALTVADCGHSGTASTVTSASEVAESSLSGLLNSTVPGGTQSFYQAHPARSFFARLENLFSLLPASFASSACPTLANTACTGNNTFTMTYSSCSYGSSTTLWNGSQNLSFPGSCPSPVTDLTQYNSKAVTRTFGAGTTETTSAGVVTTLDTATASSSGWDTSVTGVPNGETAAFNNTTGGRIVTLGIHLHGVDSGGNVLFDETASASGLAVSGTGTNLSVGTGQIITVQYNSNRYTAQAHITTALAYGTVSCCHPSSGVLTTQLTGGLTGIETLTFTGGTCGAATYVDASGNTANISLSHCF